MAIISVDFDNTITDSDTYPEISKERVGAKRVINNLVDSGHCVLINTCRTGCEMKLAKEWLDDRGIKYCHINENCCVRILKYKNDTRKLGAHIYIDDKSIETLNGNGINWDEIDIMLTKLLKDEIYSHDLCDNRILFKQFKF